MNRVEVITALAAGGYFRGQWDMDDLSYDAFSERFVDQAFEDWVHSLPECLRTTRDIGGGKTRIVPKWIAEVFDCDNHARSFGNFLNEAMAVDAVTRGVARGNAASGKFNFLVAADATKGHARTWYINHDGRALSFDAGMGEHVNETPAEQATIMGGETI